MTDTDAAVLDIDQVVAAIHEILADRGQPAVDVDADTELTAIGLDSADIADLFMTLEDMCGERFDPSSARDLRHVRDLTALRAL